MRFSKYGSSISFSRWGIMIVINGHIFSVFVGTRDKKLHATYNRNIWRKSKTPYD